MNGASTRTGLRQWMWRAFVGSALIPLILVETVLVGCYLLSNQAIRDAQLAYLGRSANDSLGASAEQNALIIENQLQHIGDTTALLARMTQEALQRPVAAADELLALSAQGARYSPEDRGGAASFYSSATPAQQHDLAKVARLSALDPLLKEIKLHDRTIASLYFNSWDSYNRIYPWFRTDQQYPPDMRIPEFNFYYLADAAHNPDKDVRWTDVYLDPAGHGWMMSAIAPVYKGDFLEGVAGIDVTVSELLTQIDRLKLPWSGYLLLVSADSTIMAMPEQAEHDFDLRELTQESHSQKLSNELFKPEDFNLKSRGDTRELAARLLESTQGTLEVSLKGRAHLIAWNTIASTGWRLLAVVDKEQVMAATNALASHYRNIGYLMIIGLLGFYLVFFSILWMRSRHLSERLRQPISGIGRMLGEIGRGQWQPIRTHSSIRELDDMAGSVLTMGGQLATSEQQRQMAQRRLMSLIDHPTSGMWEYHLEDDGITFRGGLCKRLGLPVRGMSREGFLARLSTESAIQFVDALDSLRAGRAPRIEVELRLLREDGSWLWLLCQGRTLDDSTEGTRIALGTLVDIDTLKHTEEDLRDRTLQAQAASRAKSRFISSMSHELRTPLNAIHGFAQLMSMQANDLQSRDFLQEILGASQHLGNLVDDLLDWSSLQAETQKLTLVAVPLLGLLEECAEMIGPQAQNAGLHLEITKPPPGLDVWAEPRRLRQVLLNLLSNAIKYNRPEGKLLIGAEQKTDGVCIYVEDGGMGIEPALQGELFEPFQRLGKENTAIQGTGIGLALCRELASLMEGKMGLYSVPGEGSRFWIELARGAERATNPVHTLIHPRLFYSGSDPRAMDTFRLLHADHIEFQEGPLAHCLADARDKGAPAILLVDCDEEDAARINTLRQIRRCAQGQDMSLILIGSTPRSLAMLGIEFQGVLGKPLDNDELAELIGLLLEQEHSDVY